MSKLEAIIFILKGKPVIYGVDMKLGSGAEIYLPYNRNDRRFVHSGFICDSNFNGTELKIVSLDEYTRER